MESIGSGDVEIMVHTTAPSRGLDDARYRALARAYMDFEPATSSRINHRSTSEVIDDVGEQAQSQLQEELVRSTQEERESAASYRPGEEDGASTERRISVASESFDRMGIPRSLESPVLSFNSVQDNIDSPVFRGFDLHHDPVSELPRKHDTQNSSDSWRPPRSIIADSQPEDERAIPAFASPSEILELYLSRRYPSEESSPRSGLPQQRMSDMGSENMAGSGERIQNSFESSVAQSSPSPNKPSRTEYVPATKMPAHEAPSTQDPALGLKRKWPESNTEEMQISSAPPKAMDDCTMLPGENSRAPRRQRIDDQISKEVDLPPSSTAVLPVSSPPATDTPSPWTNELEIRPSPPVTSTAELVPEALITLYLHKLDTKLSIARLFRPMEVVRELRPMERGYWLVNCSTWPEDRPMKCWTYLGNTVGKDLVGWGVWCVRDTECSHIRVYCWGIVVEYVYLLLYLASAGKIRGTGACWIAGDGTAIVTMPS